MSRAIECKSFLGSRGVAIAGFANPTPDAAAGTITTAFHLRFAPLLSLGKRRLCRLEAEAGFLCRTR